MQVKICLFNAIIIQSRLCLRPTFFIFNMKKIIVFISLACCIGSAFPQAASADSLFSAYRVYARTDSTETVHTFTYSTKKDDFQLNETTCSLMENGRVRQYSVLDEKGDSSVKVLYFYSDTCSDVSYLRYKYSLKKAKLRNTGYFQNVRYTDNEFIRLLSEYLQYDVYLCDTLHVNTHNTLLDVPLHGRYFGDIDGSQPDSLCLQTSILGIDVKVCLYYQYVEGQLADVRMTITVLGQQNPADMLYAHAGYNEDGMIAFMEVLPLKTQVYNLYKEMNGFSMRTYTYEGKRLRCFTEYDSPSKDTSDIVYRLYQRTYYTYKDDVVDSALIYSYYSAGASSDTSALSAAGTLQVKLSPNPVCEVLCISGLEKETRVEIFSAEGRRVFSTSLCSGSSRIPVQQLPSGVYFVRLQQGDCQCVKKIMKR